MQIRDQAEDKQKHSIVKCVRIAAAGLHPNRRQAYLPRLRPADRAGTVESVKAMTWL
jgi:hypothetical protein